MKKSAALLAVIATTGLLAACHPGKPIEATVYEGHVVSAEKVDTTVAPVRASGKSGRTFEAQ